VSLSSRAMQDALTSKAGSLGVFDEVRGHEPKAAPTITGVTCAVWFMGARPSRASGLNNVSMVVEYWARIYTSMTQEPQDLIDPRVMDAADALLTAIAANFTLGLPDGRMVDIFASESDGLRITAGYLTQDQKAFRTLDVVIPILINDAYPEVA
jgi:hypothetical protein